MNEELIYDKLIKYLLNNNDNKLGAPMHHTKTAGVYKLSGKLIIGRTYLNSLIYKILFIVLFDKCVVKMYLKLQTFNIVSTFVICIR